MMKIPLESHLTHLAVLVGLISIGLSLLLLLAVFLLRISWKEKARIDEKFLEIWRPIFASCMTKVPNELPHLPKMQMGNFIQIFNRYQETLRGPSKKNLKEMAKKLRIPEYCLRILKNHPKYSKIDAIKTLGHLQEKRAVPYLTSFSKRKNPIFYTAAIQAIVQIDSKLGLEKLMQSILQGKKIPTMHLYYILSDVPVHLLDQALSETIGKASIENIPELLGIAERCQCKNSTKLSLEILEKTQDPEIIQSCLKIFRSPEYLPIGKKFLMNPNWRVRLQAVLLLQRIGTKNETPLLIPYLLDESWWVRYRVTQTLLTLSEGGILFLKKLMETQKEEKAIKILKMVIAEKELSS